MNAVKLKRALVASGVVAAMFSLSACLPEDFDVNFEATLECRSEGEQILCESVITPKTTDPVDPDPTDPDPTDPDPTDPDPTDPNEGLPGADVTATPLQGQARITWTTERTDVTGWHVSRDGTDTGGHGAWGTDLPANARAFTFDLMRPGDTYTLTVVAKTAAGDLEPVTVTVVPEGTPVDPDPAPGEGDTAAEVHGWGTPIPQASDEFNVVGRPDTSRWSVAGECWAGHDGNGRRCASKSEVTTDGVETFLRQTGEANGDSAWLGSRFNQQYGKWEARVRSHGEGQGNTYHPLLIIWPQSNEWPIHGEYDFWENRAPNGTCAGHFIHYPHPRDVPVQQEGGWCTKEGVDLNEWNNVAIEWTPERVTGYLNGEQWYSYSNGAGPAGRGNIQDMPSGHLTIQLDNFHGSNMQPATYDVDWVRVYN